MKKFVVGVAVALATLIMCFCFAGCGVSGTYKFDSMTVKTLTGEEETVKAGEEYQGKTVNADAVALELNSDKTWKLKFDLMGEKSEDEVGTWEEKDDKIILSVDNKEVYKLTKDGSKLVIEKNIVIATVTIYLAK